MSDLSAFPITRKWPAEHPDRLQLYSLPTPNGVKVSIMLEELGLPYEPHLVSFERNDQMSPEFLSLNPNNKIPAILDPNGPDGKPLALFESGAILLHLAEKFGELLPKTTAGRAECLSWLFWQMGSAPYLGGGFGHFYAYAPTKMEYPIDRFAMEVKRQLDVLDKQLAKRRYIAGDEYTIADIAIWPWYGGLVKGWQYGDAATFLSAHEYKNVNRWADEIFARPAVTRGRKVNRVSGDPASQLHERHDASDFDTKTQDKLAVKV